MTLRSLGTWFFWVCFAVLSLFNFAICAMVWLVVAPFDKQRRVNHWLSCVWAYEIMRLHPGWKLRLRDVSKWDRKSAYVVVANHSSIADIPMLFCLFRQFKWVSKTSMFRIPIVGWNMRLCRYIPLVRGDKASIRRMMAACTDYLRSGMSVLVFPEGSRSPSGELGPFKHGAFTMAMETGVPVLPLVLKGAGAIMPKHGRQFAATGDLEVRVLDAVLPTNFENADELANAVRQRMLDAMQAQKTAQEATKRSKPPASAHFSDG